MVSIQLIDIPTRVTDSSISLIDLLYVDSSDDVIIHGTLPKIADHDGIFVSFNLESPKPKPLTKTIFDYKKCDIIGLTKFIKEFDFETCVFHYPTVQQAEQFTKVLTDAIARFVPQKTITIHPKDQPWCNTYTRLLLRKNNRNYQFYKKANSAYVSSLDDPNASEDIITKLTTKRNNALKKSKDSSKFSFQGNRRAKTAKSESEPKEEV